MDDKNSLNYKVIITSIPIFILTIIVRLVLGYFQILIFDLVYVVLIYTLIILFKKKNNIKALKLATKIHLILPILAFILPFLEDKEIFVQILALVSYVIPVILNFIMIYLKTKVKQ